MAEEWRADYRDDLNPTEETFLDASVGAPTWSRYASNVESADFAVLVTSLGVVAVLAIVAGLVAVRQSRIADDNAERPNGAHPRTEPLSW